MGGSSLPLGNHPLLPLLTLPWSCPATSGCVCWFIDWGLSTFDLSSWTQLALIGLHYPLVLCHSFKGCALPPSLLFHALCMSLIQTNKVASTIFWRDNQKIAGLGREILYSIQTPNPTQHWSHWRSWGCPTPVRGSQEVNLP